MEAAVRWSAPISGQGNPNRFLVADVARNSIQLGEIDTVKAGRVSTRILCERDGLPNFTAFDWSRKDESLVAIGTSFGHGQVLSVNPDSSVNEVLALPAKLQRKCNSIAFGKGSQLAIGLDKIRGDSSLNIYDITVQSADPLRRLTGAEVITNVKFFTDQPQTLVVGSGGTVRSGHSLKLFDLRERVSAATATVHTRHVHLVSLDTADENYWASAGPGLENTLSIWDRRRLSTTETSASDSLTNSPVLQIPSVFPSATQPHIWSLRFTGYKAGAFASLSDSGHIRFFDVSRVARGKHEEDGLFVRSSHEVTERQTDKVDKIICFDHAPAGTLLNSNSILTISERRQIRALNTPSQAPSALLSHVGSALIASKSAVFTLSPTSPKKSHPGARSTLVGDGNPRSHITAEIAHLSSRERHRNFLNGTCNSSRNSLALVLRHMSVQRQRCFEGYGLDPETNIGVVRDDPWLVELWEVVRRLQRMAVNQGMVQNGANLSFFGVCDLWFGSFQGKEQRLKRPPPSQEEYAKLVKQILARHSYSTFDGVETDFPARRQLALAICGWKFDERRLRAKCSDILSRKEYYKAIVVAVAHGRRDIAMDLLKSLTRTKSIENSALAAVVACSNITATERALCEWMVEEAEDPYLKALLIYFISGSWESVVHMVELPLQYRVAIALKFTNDENLGRFLTNAVEDAVEAGDTEGVILTGLTEAALELFQNYILKTKDVQTAYLAMAFVAPHGLQDQSPWELWRATYFEQMQAWSAFIQRAQVSAAHNKLVRAQAIGHKPAKHSLDRASAEQGPHSLAMMCLQCRKPIALPMSTSHQSLISYPRGTKVYTPTYHDKPYSFLESLPGSMKGKRVLVVGATGQIGSEICLSFARAGASIAFAAPRAATAARSFDLLAEDIKSASSKCGVEDPEVLGLDLDVRSQESVDRCRRRVAEVFEGRLDVVIAAHGTLDPFTRILDSEPDTWWNTWEVNLKGVYLVARAFVPLLQRAHRHSSVDDGQRGAIDGCGYFVALSSVVQHLLYDGSSAYNASKTAVHRVVECLAAELATQQQEQQHTIREVIPFVIHPGAVKSQLSMTMPKHMHPLFVESPTLAGETLAWLCRERRSWLAGRYIGCNWDMAELLERSDEIERHDLLKMRMAT
ncbi:MAG: hypothetical protein Q9162_004130 [Coniocarpon cinnabarinum]